MTLQKRLAEHQVGFVVGDKDVSEHLNKFMQAIEKDILELLNIPVYKVTETGNKAYEAGYNNMVIATELLLAEIRLKLKEYFKENK